MTLNVWSRMAKTHWKKHLPRFYRLLQRRGLLEERLKEAGEKTANLLAELTLRGLYYTEALDYILPKYILLPPENQDIKERVE